MNDKSWLPAGTTQGDLDDGDFAWLSDAYTRGDEPKSTGRKLPYKIKGAVNEDGWKAAWSRAHSMADADFEGGPSRTAVLAKLKKDKPSGVTIDDDGKACGPLREYKTFAFKAGNTDGLDENQFQGYVAAIGNIDDGGDVILPGAFRDALPFFLQNGKVCWQHDWSTPIGKWLDAREDANGLFAKGQISLTTAGKDALILLRDGVVDKLSIGYEVADSRPLSPSEGVAMFGQVAYDAAIKALPWYQDSIRALVALKVFEGSPVTFPMNNRADITGVKTLSLLAGLSHDAHYAAVHAAVREYVARVKAIQEYRQKAGRMLSAANAGKLQSMRDSLAEHTMAIDAMLAANAQADPDGDADMDSGACANDPLIIGKARAQVHHEYLRYQRELARAQGVA